MFGQKKQKKLLIIFGLLILAIFLILYFGYLRKTPISSIDMPTGGSEITLPELNLDILNDPRFQNLRPYGDLPVEVGETGRENPFLQ